MKIQRILFDEDTFGITQLSLKKLRDTLLETSGRKIAIVEIPTNDICCGFMVLDPEKRQATFTGDGFRTDRGGEGGAGYRTAEAIFNVLGVANSVVPWDLVSLDAYLGDKAALERKLLEEANEIYKQLELSDGPFTYVGERDPYYVR